MDHAVAHLDHQHAVILEEVRGIGKDALGELEAIGARRQGQLRLVTKLLRQIRHVLGVHVGWVGDDEIVLVAGGQIAHQIGADRDDLLLQAVVVDVALGHIEGIDADVDGIHFRMGELMGHDDGDATGAGAQVHDPGRFLFQEGGETVGHHLGDGGARNEHPLVHVELPTRVPGLVGQVGGRHPLLHPADDELGDAVALAGGQAGVAHARINVWRQM